MRQYPQFVEKKLQQLSILADEMRAAADAPLRQGEKLREPLGALQHQLTAIKRAIANGLDPEEFETSKLEKQIADMQAETNSQTPRARSRAITFCWSHPAWQRTSTLPSRALIERTLERQMVVDRRGTADCTARDRLIAKLDLMFEAASRTGPPESRSDY